MLACIEDPLVIGKILAPLETKQAVLVGEGRRPEVRGPPSGWLALGYVRSPDGLPGVRPAGPPCVRGVVQGEEVAGRGRFRAAS